MDLSRIDYYQLIGVAPDADAETVKRAFMEKARALIEAYGVLTEPKAREQYDLSRKFGTGVPSRNEDKELSNKGDAGELAEALDNLVVSLDGRSLLPGKKITRRLLSRIPLDRPVVVRFPDGAAKEAVLRDLSGGGALLAVRAELKAGDTVELGVTFSDPPFALARVVRIVTAKREYGVKWLQIFEENLPKGLLSDAKF